MTHRLQNGITGSCYALPIATIYAIGTWFTDGLFQQQLWPQLILILMTALTMVKLDSQHTLIRTYSRMLSCSYLVLSVAALPLFVHLNTCIVQFCSTLTYLFMLRAHQDKPAINSVFNAFFFTSAANIWLAQILFPVSTWRIILRFYIMGMGRRTFWASLLAIIIPYWFVGGYYVYRHGVNILIYYLPSITDFAPLFDLQNISLLNLLTLCFISALGIIDMLHFLLGSSGDKIRVRLFFLSFMLMMAATTVLITLQPTHLPNLLPAPIIGVSPLIDYYITFTGSRLSGITCLTLFIITLTIIGYQLWIRWQIS